MILAANGKVSRPKHIFLGDRFYTKIWQISRDIYKILKLKRTDIVPNMSQNPTTPVRETGLAIISKRFTKGRGDLHSATNVYAKQMELAHSDKYQGLQRVSFLTQRELLSWCINKWSETERDKKRATDDDRLRAMGLLFLEDMRDFIRYMLVAKYPDGRLELDEWNGMRNSAWHFSS